MSSSQNAILWKSACNATKGSRDMSKGASSSTPLNREDRETLY
jgi:hypothetical protein